MMSPAGDDLSTRQRRVSAISLVLNVVAAHVNDFVQFHGDELPEWLTGLGVPVGWRIARVDCCGIQPSRVAVCGPHFDGGWDGCDTISVFGFTGVAPVDGVRDNADCTLRDLGAEGVITSILATPPTPGVCAVRSSGYFSTAGLWVWAQYSTYLAGSDASGQGRLIQHNMFIESGCQARLGDDIIQVGNAIHYAFLGAINTC
jgi:hypothetical protein